MGTFFWLTRYIVQSLCNSFDVISVNFLFFSPADLKLEQPLETAMLLSLSGTPCLVLNQWQCEAASNRKRFHILLEGKA